MAALRSLLGKIRIPGAAPLRASWPSASSSSVPKGDLERALFLKNNIESAKEADLFSSADLLAEQADETVRAMSMLEYYWKDKPDPDLEFIAALEDPE